jgi:hypothetical protein
MMRALRMTGVFAALAFMAVPLMAQGGKADTTKKMTPPPAKAPVKAPVKTDMKAAASKAASGMAAKADASKPGAAKPDTVAAGASVSERGAKGQLSIMREVFTYEANGRRDPMVSLMSTGAIRPLLSEVEVIAILYDEDGSNSEALLRNLTDKKKMYHVKVGQSLGRMTVTQITRRDVIFTLNEFGTSTQARLSVKPDTSAARTP